MIDLTPNEAASIRIGMLEGHERSWRRGSMEDVPELTYAAALAHLATLREGELFAWRNDLTAATAEAAKVLPAATLTRELMPAPSGVYLWSQPLMLTGCGFPVAGIGWYETQQAGAYLWVYERNMPPTFALGPLVAAGVAWMMFDRTVGDSESLDARRPGAVDARYDYTIAVDSMVRFLMSSWLWLRQTIIRADRAPVARHIAKQAARCAMPSTVRVIALRRAVSAARHDGAGDREYSCQWLVHGHWRAQYYPSTNVHRPLWIEPYIKGPEDAPFRVSPERVFNVKR